MHYASVFGKQSVGLTQMGNDRARSVSGVRGMFCSVVVESTLGGRPAAEADDTMATADSKVSRKWKRIPVEECGKDRWMEGRKDAGAGVPLKACGGGKRAGRREEEGEHEKRRKDRKKGQQNS